MQVTFITTLDHNIGDDFVRDGIKYILKHTLEHEPEYQYIHKHAPITTRSGFENIRSPSWSNRIDRFLPIWSTKDKIKNADVIIQSGAPVYWLNNQTDSTKNEWYEPLITKRYLKFNKNSKLLNIGAGSCQEYYSDGSEFLSNSKFLKYVNEFHNLCDLTCVRDDLSFRLLSNQKLNAIKLPCPSIFSKDYHSYLSKQDGEYVVLNYMQGGGHFDFSNVVDSVKWKEEFRRIHDYVSSNEEVILVCHDSKELNWAKDLNLKSKIFHSSDYKDYIEFYSNAKYGVVNRVHAGFQLASHGKPSIIIGSDSRAVMAKEIALKSFFVNDFNFEIFKTEYESLIELSHRYAGIINEIKAKSLKEYEFLLDKILEDM